MARGLGTPPHPSSARARGRTRPRLGFAGERTGRQPDRLGRRIPEDGAHRRAGHEADGRTVSIASRHPSASRFSRTAPTFGTRGSTTRDAQLAPDGTGFAAGAVERAARLLDRLLPARPLRASRRDPGPHSRPRPSRSASIVGRMNAVLNSESVASGGPNADYKMLCDEAGQIRVDPDRHRGTSFSQVVAAARAAGYNTNRADYVVFVDNEAGGACGIASYNEDETLSADNEVEHGRRLRRHLPALLGRRDADARERPPHGRGPVQRPELDRQRRPLLRGGRRHVLLARRRRHQPGRPRHALPRHRRASTATSTTTSTRPPSPASTSRATGISARR